jgi:glycosyltransferase involved in cell wall biosynthesis
VAPNDYFPVIERLLPGSGSCYHISKALRTLVARERLDVVELANWEGLGALFTWRRPVPVVVRLHTSTKEAYSLGGRTVQGPIKWDVRRERWQARLADALVTHSDVHRKEMARELGIGEDRIAVIPHGIPVQCDFRRAEGDAARPTVVFLGRLEIRKGTIDLLHAIPEVLSAVPRARFVLIGLDRDQCPGNRSHARYVRDTFAPKVQARIEFLGQLPDDAVDRLLQTADLLVAPSLYESFGLVFLEAMRWGTPVIGTTAGAIPEVVENGRTGLLVPPQSPGDLAAAIIALLQDAGRRRALGEAGRRRVETYYTVERMAERVEEFYRDVLDQCMSWAHQGRRRQPAVPLRPVKAP